MSEFSAELTEIRRFADALLMGKIVGETGLTVGTLKAEDHDGKPETASYEVKAQSRVNPEGAKEYYLIVSDGNFLEGTGTKRLFFNDSNEITYAEEGTYFPDVGYRFPIDGHEERGVFLRSMIGQLVVDMPELAADPAS
jgi:hypothetical protein